ncbi:SCO2400 family protein [Streptomyces sp. NPDC001492]
MDYCSSCRRHLNGALVCPGCGAYAPDIAPVTSHGHAVPAPAATAMWPEVEETPETDAYGDAEGGAEAAIPLSEGRAARRRQRARWKKNQRKAVVATAVALVGGGLTLASMDRGSGHRAEASTATDLSSMGSEDGSADQNAQLPPAGTGKHRKSDTTADHSTTSGKAQQHSGATASHTDSARTQPYTPAAHSTPATKPAQQGSVATVNTPSVDKPPVTGGTTTTTQTPSATPTGGTGSGTSSTSGSSGTSGSSTSTSGTSQSDNSSSATSPSGICVLGLLCVS